MPEDEHLTAILSDQDKREVLNDRLLELSVPAHLALMMAESAVLTRRTVLQGRKAFLTVTDEQGREQLISFNDGKFKEALSGDYPELFKSATTDHAMIAEALQATTLTARGELVKRIGKDAADSHARRFGLSGAHDLRPGTPPAGFASDDPAAIAAPIKPETKSVMADDPFAFGGTNTGNDGRYSSAALLRQSQLIRHDPARAAALAKRAGVKIGDNRVARSAAA